MVREFKSKQNAINAKQQLRLGPRPRSPSANVRNAASALTPLTIVRWSLIVR